MTHLKFHQGDVIGASIETIPGAAVPMANKPIALGEVSGHVHILTGNAALYEIDGRLFAIVGESGARLQHTHQSYVTNRNNLETTKKLPVADHKSILLPTGKYEFWIQKAYNPFEKALEDVLD